jgi:membrane carboxypeptidase/penicillin-binding protein
MEALLVKIFATGLALSQVTTTPNVVKTEFDRQRDQLQVAKILHAGCAHMLKVFELEDINIDDLIATAMDDPQAIEGAKVLRGIELVDLQRGYKQFCKNEKVDRPAVDLGAVIDFYNEAAANLPDHTRLKEHRLPGSSIILDRKGKPFAEVFEENQRRVWVKLEDIPEHVRNAFIAAEDKRFYQHRGIDERGLIRAFLGNLAHSGRPQGGSTITQQVVKNLLVGEDVSYERKIREMIVAARLESTLTKDEILELYLNCVYLGRGAWGVEVASRSYFGKPAIDLTLNEGALLAGLTKGPTYFSPDRHPARARERLAYVLNRMREDGTLGMEPQADGSGHGPPLPVIVANAGPRRDIGFHFVDQVAREARAVAGLERITDTSYTVRSTIDQVLERAVEQALQEGLAQYERRYGRAQFSGPEANLGSAMLRLEADRNNVDRRPFWQQALANARLPLYDVHWTPAVVVTRPGGKRGDSWRVGLADGRTLPLTVDSGAAQSKLALNDVVFVHLAEGRGKTPVRAELRVRPTVQGTVVVLENKTGRILAMAGGFSYPLSQLNRATQSVRQPGSAIKPLSYLAALGHGLQPNTLVSDSAITLPPIKAGSSRDYWSPKNYDGGERGVLTLRQALENSRNLATAHLLQGGIEDKPEASLDRLCQLAQEAQIYRECLHYYPFVLGAEPVRPVDLAAFFAAIANEGLRPAPHVIDFVEREGAVVYRHDPALATRIASVDQVAFYQLKTMMQGVLARGTAQSIADLAPYVAGKTGTTDDENDAWFVGFTNEVTVAVWVGYDNADGKRRTLGGGATGGGVAVPIFESIIRAVWNQVAPRTALAPPSPEAKRDLSCEPVDTASGEAGRGATRTTECLRVDDKGKIIDATMALLEPGGGSRHAKKAKKRDDAAEPRKKMASRERHRQYVSERVPTPPRQVVPQWGFFGGGFGNGGWFGSAAQYGGGFWGR